MLIVKPQLLVDNKGGIHAWESVPDTQTSSDHESPCRVSGDRISFVSGAYSVIYLLLESYVLDQTNPTLRVPISVHDYKGSLV